jgi:arylformamidase
MIVWAEIGGQNYFIEIDKPLSIAIALDFAGAQPSVFGAEKATAKTCETRALIGDTRRGGSCNFEQIKLIPHCNGTHTESIGHLTTERVFVNECLKDVFIPAVVVSIEPEASESYPFEIGSNEKLITRSRLEKSLENVDKSFLRALIVRTLPNRENKQSFSYGDFTPFFSTEAMNFIVGQEVKHLLTDLPSIDRLNDGGKLSNHRIFWNLPPRGFELKSESALNNTITELIYVPDEIADGCYLLNLQIPAFVSDAAPSRPILFRVQKYQK